MSDSEKRHCWESYKKLARTDFKCLENEINKINSGKNDPKALFEKLLEIIEPSEDERCGYIGQCIKNEDYKEVKECKKCKGYWFTADETFNSYYEMWKKWKNGSKIDPDDSKEEGQNPFIRAVYYLLWGKKIVVGKEANCGIYEDGWRRFSTSYVFPAESGSKSKTMLLGSDTMNTIKTYKDNIEKFLHNQNGSELVNELCRKCHQLGNFVLVPAYYNRYKGGRQIQDQMDVALEHLLKGNIKEGFIGQTSLQSSKSKTITKEEKEKVANEKFYRWDKEHFSQYINMFFLWDYVKPESEKTYFVKDMKSEEVKRVTNNTQVNKDNVEQYITNANLYIEKRSIFMAAMLAIAVEFKGVKIILFSELRIRAKRTINLREK